MRLRRPTLALAVILAVAGCKSGGGNGCETGDAEGLAPSAWPKFRKDLGNTGHIEATVADNPAELWVFPPRSPTPGSSAITTGLTSAVIIEDNEGVRIVIVAQRSDFPTTARVYQIDRADGTESSTSFDVPLISTLGIIAGTSPLISQNRIDVIFADATLREFELDGNLKAALPSGGVVTGSPTLDSEGTVFTGANSGLYTALCADGGARYQLGIGSTASSPALRLGETVDDNVTIIGSNDGHVRAFLTKGDLLWTFSASAAVQATVVYDIDSDLVFGADTSGLVFAAQAADGRRCRNLGFKTEAPIVASPAFANNTLYVVDTAGGLYALTLPTRARHTPAAGTPTPTPGGPPTPAFEIACDTSLPSSTPQSAAPGSTGGPLTPGYRSGAEVLSSPAVATKDGKTVVVFGANDGAVRAIDHNADNTLHERWKFQTQEGAPIDRSSVAIDRAGVVYITTAAGRLYAIGEGGTPTPSFSPTGTPTTAPTNTVPPTSTPTSSPAPTDTAVSTETPVATPVPTDSSAVSPSPSASVTPTNTPEP